MFDNEKKRFHYTCTYKINIKHKHTQKQRLALTYDSWKSIIFISVLMVANQFQVFLLKEYEL